MKMPLFPLSAVIFFLFANAVPVFPAENPLGLAAAHSTELPAGFVLAGESDSGRALVRLKQDTKSARKLMSETIADFARYFDGRPEIEVVYGNKEDSSSMASFRAKLAGKEMKGAMFTSIGDQGGTSVIVYDREEAPAASLALLASAAKPRGNPRWELARIPDGSGTLNLPEGWKITGASNGGVDVAGPLGETVSLGIAFTIFTPQAEAYFQQQRRQLGLPRAPSGFLISPYCEPADAVKTLIPQFSRISQAAGRPAFRLLKIIETANLEDRQGKSAYVHMLVEIGDGKNAFRQEGLALVKCMPMGAGRWQYYFSQVTAPEAIFQHDLPTMTNIWQSWRIDPASTAERMNKALAVMNQTREMLSRSAQYQEKVRSQSSAEWDSIISGYGTVIDKATGNLITTDSSKMKETVDRLNDKAGYKQFKEIQVAE